MYIIFSQEIVQNVVSVCLVGEILSGLVGY